MAQADIPQKTKLIMTTLALFMPVFLVLPFFFWGGEEDNLNIDKELQAIRLAPVGQLTVGTPVVTASADATAATATAFDAQSEYDKVCAACHTSGVLNAPKLGDTAAWQARLNDRGGLDGLVKQAIQGVGGMPPKGGSTISDVQFHEMVLFMLDNAKVPH